jgi:hydroxyethylthiazole kinase-like uncharacterized protein yjeF
VPHAEIVTPAALREWPLPSASGSKHSRGHVLVVGGSRATPGAAMLCGIAALRVGAGVLGMLVPDDVALPVAVALPEAGVWSLSEGLEEQAGRADAIVIGPGLDDAAVTGDILGKVLKAADAETPLVLDAYALGVLPDLPDVRAALRGRAVLTPNSSEADILLRVTDSGNELGSEGDSDAGEGADSVSQALADAFGCCVSHGGYVATAGEQLRQIATGHSGLGTSGSGDVLAGAVAGLLARGATLTQGAAWGTYLHAAAGDRLAARVGRLGFLARELTEELPLVLTELQS